MSNKPYPPSHIHELLLAIGFYSDGFCAGHCEHAPLRTSNPELNSQIEAWHDKYYTSPDTPIKYTLAYIVASNPEEWARATLDLAYSSNSYAPAEWLMQSGDNLSNYLEHQSDWYNLRFKPALNKVNSIVEANIKNFPLDVDDTDDPF